MAGAVVARLLGKEVSQGRGEEGAACSARPSRASDHDGIAEFWVAVAFVAFLADPPLLQGAEAHRQGARRPGRCDPQGADEARRLRDEAQALLADYQAKHRNVGEEAQAIVNQAKHEADAFAHESREALKDMVERRTKLAEEKIARAEAQAVDEVRAAAVDTAMTAAERILREKRKAPAAPP